MAVHQCTPSNLVALKRFCQEEWQKIPKEKCDKLMTSLSERLEAVISLKVKGLDTYVNGILQCFHFYRLNKTLKKPDFTLSL